MVRTGDATSTPERDEFTELIQARNALHTQQLIDRARRGAVGERARLRFFEQLAAKAGTDLSLLRRMHERDWQTLLRNSRAQERGAFALLRQQRKRQQDALRTIARNRERFEYRKGNPHTSICIWRAAQIPTADFNVQTFSQGIATLDNQITGFVGPSGDNRITFGAHVEGPAPTGLNGDPVAALEILTRHTFEATIPHDGSLSVTGQFAPLGTVFLGAPGFCLEPDGSAGVTIEAYLRVRVDSGGRRPLALPLGETKVITDRHVRPTCEGDSEVVSVGTIGGVSYQLTHADVIGVDAGDVVQVTAGYSVYIAGASRGAARANFFERGFGLNVPMVMLKVAG